LTVSLILTPTIIFVELLMFTFFLVLFWGIELGMLIPSIPRVRGKTLLELTPEWISVKLKCFGINFSRRIPRIPTAALRESDITWHVEDEKPVLIIKHGGKTLRVGSERSKLTLADVKWLAREIREYIKTINYKD
jgi:hypothetical protein